MSITFASCIASQGDRLTIAIPKIKHKDVKNLIGKQLKVTIEEI